MENITQIINGCINKEHKYQKVLYERYRDYALRIVFRYIYRYDAAVDAVNDGFVKLFNHFHKFEKGTDADNEKIFAGWMKKIMINVSIDYLRRSNMLPEIGGISKDVWELSKNKDDADQTMLYNDLIVLIKELPPAYRIVFNLYVIDGYSHIEIAAMINTTAGNSKSTLSRARELLRKSIKKTENASLCSI